MTTSSSLGSVLDDGDDNCGDDEALTTTTMTATCSAVWQDNDETDGQHWAVWRLRHQRKL